MKNTNHMIKYNSKTVNDWLYSDSPIKKLMYNGRQVYKRFVANGSPTPPAFDGKFKAEYSDGRSYSADCDGKTSLATETTKPSGYVYTSMTEATIGQCVTVINAYAFQNCYSLTSVTIPSGVTSIGSVAFNNCSGLTSIDIPNSVTTIREDAFKSCYSLTSVTIGSGVTSIGGNAFRNCSSLTSIVIPNSVTSIGSNAFYNCRSLSSITVEAVIPPTVGGDFTFDNTNNCPIYVPDASVDAYKAASGWSALASRIKPISEKP